MSGPVNGSPGADRRGLAVRALEQARWGVRWLEEHDHDDPNAGRMRAATITEWGRVLRYADDEELRDEARGALDDFQRMALERELAKWSTVLLEHGFLPAPLDPETLGVLAQARLDELPTSARWSLHERHGGGQ